MTGSSLSSRGFGFREPFSVRWPVALVPSSSTLPRRLWSGGCLPSPVISHLPRLVAFLAWLWLSIASYHCLHGVCQSARWTREISPRCACLAVFLLFRLFDSRAPPGCVFTPRIAAFSACVSMRGRLENFASLRVPRRVSRSLVAMFSPFPSFDQRAPPGCVFAPRITAFTACVSLRVGLEKFRLAARASPCLSL